jgi:hypothetical protein
VPLSEDDDQSPCCPAGWLAADVGLAAAPPQAEEIAATIPRASAAYSMRRGPLRRCLGIRNIPLHQRGTQRRTPGPGCRPPPPAGRAQTCSPCATGAGLIPASADRLPLGGKQSVVARQRTSGWLTRARFDRPSQLPAHRAGPDGCWRAVGWPWSQPHGAGTTIGRLSCPALEMVRCGRRRRAVCVRRSVVERAGGARAVTA